MVLTAKSARHTRHECPLTAPGERLVGLGVVSPALPPPPQPNMRLMLAEESALLPPGLLGRVLRNVESRCTMTPKEGRRAGSGSKQAPATATSAWGVSEGMLGRSLSSPTARAHCAHTAMSHVSQSQRWGALHGRVRPMEPAQHAKHDSKPGAAGLYRNASKHTA